MYFRETASSCRREKKPSIPVESGETRGPEEGVIVTLCADDTYGFIKPDHNSHGHDIYFHCNNLVNKGSTLGINDRVQFRLTKNKKGKLEANDIFVQVSVNQINTAACGDVIGTFIGGGGKGGGGGAAG